MDTKKQFKDLQFYLKNFNTKKASKLLSDEKFVTNNVSEIIALLGKELSNFNLENKPNYFKFCEEQLLKIAQSGNYQETIFDFLELIDMNECVLSSSVLIAVTILENTKIPDRACLEYLLISTFNHFKIMKKKIIRAVLLNIMQHLIRLKKHFHHEKSILYYFARVAFFMFHAKINSIDYSMYTNILKDLIYDPFSLLEHEFEEIEENVYLASFFYLYFQTGITWGPKIYNPLYIQEKCSYLAFSAFDNNFGKSFTKLMLIKYKNNEIPLYLLNKCHENFVDEAIYSCMYHDELNVRKESIESLMIFMDKLSTDGQYIVFKKTFSKPIDSCVKAQLMIKMKDLIIKKIMLNQNIGCFQGEKLLDLVRLCIEIEGGISCQVIKNKEHILAAITLLYVLNVRLNIGKMFLKDLKTFVKTVQEAIDVTNEQYLLESEKLNKEVIEKKDLNPPKISENDHDIIVMTENDGSYLKHSEETMNQPKLTHNDRRNMLAHFSTSIKLLQSGLDKLKNQIKNYQ